MQRVAAAGVVDIVARIFFRQPVVGRIVDPAKRQRRSHLIAFGRMVVNDVENNFDAGRMEIAHHGFEFGNGVHRVGSSVIVFRREIVQRVVAPVVRQAFLNKMPIIQMVMNPAIARRP